MTVEAPSAPRPALRGVIHTWAFAGAVVAALALVASAFGIEGTRAGLATAVYATSVCGVFGVSALYHRGPWRTDRTRARWRRADHAMIFLFIAGCYTPFAVLGLPPTTGRVLLAVVWTSALAAVAREVVGTSSRWWGVALYLVLGWAIVPVAPQLVDRVGIVPPVLLAAGGLLYSGGAVVYALRRPDPWPRVYGFHEVFHTATVLAAICHAVAVGLVVFG